MKELQIEHGNFTRIVNKLLEELIKLPFTGAEFSVCLFVIRKTYGFNKPEDRISLTQFIQGTNRTRPTVVKALKNLKLVNIIKLVKRGNSRNLSNQYRLNKYFHTWQLVNIPKLVKNRSLTSKENIKKLVNTTKPTKDNTKDNTKETHFPFKSVWEKYPNKVGVKAAKRHFLASVKTQADFDNINKALDNYIKSERVTKGFIQNGSTWFNDWQAWVDYKPQPTRRIVS